MKRNFRNRRLVFKHFKENKTKQNKTKQNKTKQNKTKQNKTKQNKLPAHWLMLKNSISYTARCKQCNLCFEEKP